MIHCIVSPYSFDGSIVRFERLVELAKEKGMKSLLLADVNFHAAVRFNVLCRQNGLVPVHGLRKGEKVFYARDREEFEELVRSYNENREPNLDALNVADVRLVYYLDSAQFGAHRLMASLMGTDPHHDGDLSGKFIDPAEVLKARPYDLKVVHKLLAPPEGWLDEILGKAPYDRKERLSREISLVRKLGFEPYFYTVKRIVDIAKERGILIGPGRGSAVGSLLAYLLGITAIDPVVHELMLERFLHEGRSEPPDIDIDVADEQRNELLNLLREQFPYFAQISTFVTLTEKNLSNEAKRLNLKLDSEMFKHLVGLPVRKSVHAAGIILAAEPLNLPLVPSFNRVAEYDMDSLKQIGVVKIDILGLRTLTVLDRIRKRVGLKEVNFDDEKTYELLSQGKTCGIFQLESSSARKLCRLIRPANLQELSILLALNRPGPLVAKLDRTYAERKRGCSRGTEGMFRETHGVIVYQEQIMKLAMDFAGLNAAEADVFRKAISEKDPKVLKTALDKFRDRLREKAYSSDFIDNLCDVLAKFAAYAFNKSHSVAYSYLSYELAYLKAHWPREFFELYLREHSSEKIKIFLAVQELRAMGYRVLPPSINFTQSAGEVFRLPLEVVGGVGESVVRLCRELAPFSSLREFVERSKLPLSTIQKLVWAGAFDELYGDRTSVFEDFEAVQKGFDKELSMVAAKVFGRHVENKPSSIYSEPDFAEYEERALGFPLTPFGFESEKKFAPLAEVFASARTLPVAAKVLNNFASDGTTIVRLKDRLDDGFYVLVMSCNGHVIEHRKLEEVQSVVYELQGCFDEQDLEVASDLECVRTQLLGKRVTLLGFRPILDGYRITIVPR